MEKKTVKILHLDKKYHKFHIDHKKHKNFATEANVTFIEKFEIKNEKPKRRVEEQKSKEDTTNFSKTDWLGIKYSNKKVSAKNGHYQSTMNLL